MWTQPTTVPLLFLCLAATAFLLCTAPGVPQSGVAEVAKAPEPLSTKTINLRGRTVEVPLSKVDYDFLCVEIENARNQLLELEAEQQAAEQASCPARPPTMLGGVVQGLRRLTGNKRGAVQLCGNGHCTPESNSAIGLLKQHMIDAQAERITRDTPNIGTLTRKVKLLKEERDKLAKILQDQAHNRGDVEQQWVQESERNIELQQKLTEAEEDAARLEQEVKNSKDKNVVLEMELLLAISRLHSFLELIRDLASPLAWLLEQKEKDEAQIRKLRAEVKRVRGMKTAAQVTAVFALTYIIYAHYAQEQINQQNMAAFEQAIAQMGANQPSAFTLLFQVAGSAVGSCRMYMMKAPELVSGVAGAAKATASEMANSFFTTAYWEP